MAVAGAVAALALPGRALLPQLVTVCGFAAILWRMEGVQDHAAPAALAALATWGAVHAAIGAVLAGWASRQQDRRISVQWQRYAALVTIVSAAFPILLRLLAEGAA